MIARGSAVLVPVLILAGCGGSTLRVAQDNPSEDSGPVALAPAPEAPPESTTVATPTAPSAAAAPAPEASPADSSAVSGYAPYGAGASDLEVRRIGQWSHTGISESRRQVIRNANEWAQFWSELGVGDRPAVDFSSNLVVAVAAGQRSSGGYEIQVQRVAMAKGELTIEVQETAPGPNCVTTGALTQPVDVVTVPAVGARTWSFLERKEVRGCH